MYEPFSRRKRLAAGRRAIGDANDVVDLKASSGCGKRTSRPSSPPIPDPVGGKMGLAAWFFPSDMADIC